MGWGIPKIGTVCMVVVLIAAGPAAAQEFQIPNERVLRSLSPDQRAAMERQMTTEALAWPLSTLNQEMPQPDIMDELSPRRTGTIRGTDDLHRASGDALVFELEGDRGFVRLENFEAVRGPGLHVYLVRRHTPEAPGDLGPDFLDLGPLKANTGNHNYTFQGAWSRYRSVVIFSQPFGVIFAVAPLQ